jgi:hypothetical protein
LPSSACPPLLALLRLHSSACTPLLARLCLHSSARPHLFTFLCSPSSARPPLRALLCSPSSARPLLLALPCLTLPACIPLLALHCSPSSACPLLLDFLCLPSPACHSLLVSSCPSFSTVGLRLVSIQVTPQRRMAAEGDWQVQARPTRSARTPEKVACGDYLNGKCTKSADDCRFLHDKVEICQNFLRGACSRSAQTCRFLHSKEGKSELSYRRERSRGHCLDFINGSCAKAEACLFLHANTSDQIFTALATACAKGDLEAVSRSLFTLYNPTLKHTHIRLNIFLVRQAAWGRSRRGPAGDISYFRQRNP